MNDAPDETEYRLDEQVGYILRQVTQRHLSIFSLAMPEQLTPTQFAALARLLELGATPQTQLGRLTAMDAATIKGVIDRLRRRGLVQTAVDADDARLLIVSLTPAGRRLAQRSVRVAAFVSRDTLAPLLPDERGTLLGLLARLR